MPEVSYLVVETGVKYATGSSIFEISILPYTSCQCRINNTHSNTQFNIVRYLVIFCTTGFSLWVGSIISILPINLISWCKSQSLREIFTIGALICLNHVRHENFFYKKFGSFGFVIICKQ